MAGPTQIISGTVLSGISCFRSCDNLSTAAATLLVAPIPAGIDRLRCLMHGEEPTKQNLVRAQSGPNRRPVALEFRGSPREFSLKEDKSP